MLAAWPILEVSEWEKSCQNRRGGEPENLKWGDVNFRPDESALLNIRFPKIIKNMQGDFVDIFGLEGKDYCPVKCLKALAKNAAPENSNGKKVFSFSDGTCLTTSQFTLDLQNLLANVFGPAVANLSGHSFRAGIPAALYNRPDIASESDVMSWGRWSSVSYKLYTRLSFPLAKLFLTKLCVLSCKFKTPAQACRIL